MKGELFRKLYLRFNFRLSSKIFVANYLVPDHITTLVKKTIRERPNLLSFQEMYNLAYLVSNLSRIDGELAEAGVYAGASAKLINLIKPKSKKLFLFDTFEGLPKKSAADQDIDALEEGEYNCSYDSVRRYINDGSVRLHKGMFPKDTGKHIKDTKFCFVHPDMDLYESTRDALNFFSSRMTKQGIILCHDYPTIKGVKKAVEDFCAKSGKVPIRLSGNQVIIVF